MPYASEHPSLPPAREHVADSLGALLRELRGLRMAADDTHWALQELDVDVPVAETIPDRLAGLIVAVEEAMGALGARVPRDAARIGQTWAARAELAA